MNSSLLLRVGSGEKWWLPKPSPNQANYTQNIQTGRWRNIYWNFRETSQISGTAWSNFIKLMKILKWYELSICHKLKFSNPYIFVTFNISNLDFLIYLKSWFKIIKVYNIGLQRYRDKKIRVVAKIRFIFSTQHLQTKSSRIYN